MVIVLAASVAATLLAVLMELGLDAAIPKCHKFVVDGIQGEGEPGKNDAPINTKRRLQERNIHCTTQGLERMQGRQLGVTEDRLPLSWGHSFKLAGVFFRLLQFW